VTMKEWSVLVEAFAPAGDPGVAEESEEVLGRLVDLLEPFAGAVSGNSTTWSAQIAMHGESAAQAIEQAIATVRAAARQSGFPDWPIEHVEAEEWGRFAASLEVSNFPDIVGPSEAVEILGVSRQRLHELRSNGQFPRPMVELGIGAIWLRSTIESFNRHRARKPGRRPMDVTKAATIVREIEHIRRDKGGLAEVEETTWLEAMTFLQRQLTVSEASLLLDMPSAWVYDRFMGLPTLESNVAAES
jgi:hypothetical protein